ncbi:MAG: hypothetical protein JNK67_20210 [Alphaproteobacteria bacterium]|nr:hypothetical protein [Alphaproteobacteria bacterium]
MWNSLEVAKLIAGLATPLAVVLIGRRVSLGLKELDQKFQREQDDRRRQLDLADKQHKDEVERRHTPHIELQLGIDFLGERDGLHLARVTVTAENKGQVLHKFSRIAFRLRGIKQEPFEPRTRDNPAVSFPHKILDTNLVPDDWEFIFIEPGVRQRITLNAVVPSDYTYVLGHVLFEYKRFWPHTADIVCKVPGGEDGIGRPG